MLHVIHTIQRVPTELVKEYEELSSATVHEASGGKGALSANIKPISSDMVVCGPAITVKLRPGSVQKLQWVGVVYRKLAKIDRTTKLAVAWRRDDESPVLKAFVNVTREIALQTSPRNGRRYNEQIIQTKPILSFDQRR